MKRLIFIIGVLAAPLLLAKAAEAGEELRAWWTFDKERGNVAVDCIGQREDALCGNFEYGEGVRGSALRFDGYTTRLVRKAAEAPQISGSFTIEAWVAPQEYPWNWCAIANQQNAHQAGFFFGIDQEGRVGLHGAVGGQWKECVSAERIPLLQWSHVAGVFQERKGFSLYIHGRLAGHLSAEGGILPAEGVDLLLGMSCTKMHPAYAEREPSRKLLSNMIFDGLMDEIKIHSRAMTEGELLQASRDPQPKKRQPLRWRVLPSGPEGPGRFCASYCRLRYCEEWERLWRAGPWSDILVRFDSSPVRLVFWRGMNYGAAWVTENGLWMGDQSLESWGEEWGCSEHMSDKQCRYAHARIIENHDARVVVHWRYALADIQYGIVNTDGTGWGDWADEYYTVYPDCVAVRHQVLWSTGFGKNWHQWQETILYNRPGHKPQDTVEYEAFTLANMKGESHTYSWKEGIPKAFGKPDNASIQMIHFRAKHRPFTIFEPGVEIGPFRSGSLEGYSIFPCWNHWPVAQLPNDGRNAPALDRPSHTSLSGAIPVLSDGEGISKVAVSLYGMTEKRASELAPLARSWNSPPPLRLSCRGFRLERYDKTQRAYVIWCETPGNPGVLEFELPASGESPLVNPAFVIKNWGALRTVLKISGREAVQGRDFRYGHHHRLEGSDLIVWIPMESVQPISLSLQPAGP